MKPVVLVVGGGLIGQEYSKILSTLCIQHTIISRSLDNNILCSECAKTIKGDILTCDQSFFLDFTHVIVAVQPRLTFDIVLKLLEFSACNILAEKPVTLFANQLDKIDEEVFDRRVFVAFNRRFYETTQWLNRELDKEEPLSIHCDFTELRDRMKGAQVEIDNWGMCNSIHLFDMCFYLFGLPDEIDVMRKNFGDVEQFFVSGKIGGSNLYMTANWGAPGNWHLSVVTKNKKYIFDPLEELYEQKISSITKDLVVDRTWVAEAPFKPGFNQQVLSFLSCERNKFASYQYYKSLSLLVEKIFR